MQQPQGPTTPSPPPALPDLGLLFDLTPLPLLIISPAWRITRASSRFLTDWHVSAADCIGQQLLSFIESQLLPPRFAHYGRLTTAIDDAIASRAPRISKPISTKHTVSWTARVVPVFNGDELLSIFLEWTESPASSSEEDLELVKPGVSTDEAFRILVQAVKDYAIFLLDTKGRIASWNDGAELLKGYKRHEIIGKHFSIFYGKEDLEIRKPEMELEICMREGRVEDEGWRYRRDGSRFWANVVITAVYKDGVHVGFGKVTRDLTERKSAESRLIAAYEESEKLKSDFLANMSHEIRTPMHGMLSACTLLLDTPLSDKQRDIVNIMDESGQVLLQVINDILDYSKLSSGTFSIHSDIVGITSIVTSVVRSVQATLSPSVDFELFLAPDLPRSVQGDPLRYRQVLHNLVGNAAKFTAKGSIRVRASVQREEETSYVVLTEVTDTGIGIPEAATASLFTPFTQFEATTTRGTGLGLSIAKSLTELMGGTIGYRPNPERHGSVFWFTTRFDKIKTLEQMQNWKKKLVESDVTTTPIQEDEITNLRRELGLVASRKNLLVVEDNVINQKVILGMLRSIGLKNVVLASNGLDAVKIVRGKPAAYDLVLMDINMPVLDGYEAAKQIREAGVYVPIVAMTAYALKGDRERCLEHGMNDYIPKPVDKNRLIKILGKWLLIMTDYRKTFEERLANLKRQHAASLKETPESDKPGWLSTAFNLVHRLHPHVQTPDLSAMSEPTPQPTPDDKDPLSAASAINAQPDTTEEVDGVPAADIDEPIQNDSGAGLDATVSQGPSPSHEPLEDTPKASNSASLDATGPQVPGLEQEPLEAIPKADSGPKLDMMSTQGPLPSEEPVEAVTKAGSGANPDIMGSQEPLPSKEPLEAVAQLAAKPVEGDTPPWA